MELTHRFEVPVGIDRAWASLLDMEQVAACFPGATLTSADGKEYSGSVKVKLGPIQLTYKGSARIVEADEAAHRAVIEASGNAARSGSTASMTVNATANALAEDRTEVTMTTDLTITGRPAQFGRGVMAEVGDKILGRFSECLASKLGGAEQAGAAAAAAGAGDGGAGAAGAGDAGETSGNDGGSGAAPAAAGAEAATSDTATDAATDAAKTDAATDAAGAKAPDAAAGTSAAAGAGAGAGSERAAGSEQPRAAASSGPQSYTRSPEPIDLLESAGTPVLKRVAPIVGGLVVLWLIRRMFKRRRNRKNQDD